MVLNDGTTYTDLDGCSIVAVPDEMPEDEVEHFVKHADGYYCFTDQPTELEGNNGYTMTDLAKMDYDYYRENRVRIENITTPWGPPKGL
jgi:hypothetical protein